LNIIADAAFVSLFWSIENLFHFQLTNN
jgi:hypothetical protein